MTKPEVGMREWAITVTDLTMLLGGGLWKTWELWIKKDVEHSKHGLVGHPSWSLQHKSSESNVVYKDPSQGLSEGNNISSVRKWVHFPHIFTKKVSAFFPCPRNLPEANFKTIGLILSV